MLRPGERSAVGLPDGRTMPLAGRSNLLRALQPYDLIFVKPEEARSKVARAELRVRPQVRRQIRGVGAAFGAGDRKRTQLDDPPFVDGNHLRRRGPRISTKERADYTAIVTGEATWPGGNLEMYIQPHPIIM